MNRILCIFDTNIFIDSSQDDGYKALIDLLQKNKQIVMPHFCDINFYELLRGINNNDDLFHRQECIKKAKHISLGGNIFLSPHTHIKINAGLINKESADIEVKNMITSINTFIHIKDYEQFIVVFGKALKHDHEKSEAITNGYNSMAATIMDKLRLAKGTGTYNEYKNIINDMTFYFGSEFLMESMIKRFNLESIAKMDTTSFWSRFPSLKYYPDMYCRYVCELALNRRVAKPSDYHDLDYVFYLDMADYFITNDKSLRNLALKTRNEALRDRFLSLSDFNLLLQKAIIPKKAPILDFTRFPY